MPCCRKKKEPEEDDDKNEEKLTTCVYVKDTILKLLWPTFGYYNDVVSDYLVLRDYYDTKELGYFGITCFAMFCSLLAQTIFSKSVTTFRVTNTSKCLRVIISMIYGTPLFILYYMINYEWLCKKRIKQEQTQDNERRQLELKFMILDESIIENDRISIFKSYFQSTILTFVQVYILSQYIMLKPDEITLSYPSTTRQFVILLYSTTTSFKSLADCAWARIEGFISNTAGVGTYVKLLFRIRAIIETFIRALRFMIASIVFYNTLYGGSIGIIVLLFEFIWKFIVCYWFGRGKKGITMNFRIYTVATWMIFSHERFKQYPYFMRICDIFIWTALITIIPVGLTYVDILNNTLKFDGVCTEVLQFRNNCIPIELISLLAVFWVILAVCYWLTPPIFSMNYKSEINQQTQSQNNMNTMVNNNINQLQHHHAIQMTNTSMDDGENNIESPVSNNNDNTDLTANSNQSITSSDEIPNATKSSRSIGIITKCNVSGLEKNKSVTFTNDTIDDHPKCMSCNTKMGGPISSSFPRILDCQNCKEIISDQYYFCIKCVIDDVAEFAYCNDCVSRKRSKSITNNIQQGMQNNCNNASHIRSNSMPNTTNNNNSFQRDIGRIKTRDFTMRFNISPMDDTNENKNNSVDSSPIVNVTNIEPIMTQNRNFQRGAGRFGRDYTLSNNAMIYTFSDQPSISNTSTFQRGKGRFAPNYTKTNAIMIDTFSNNALPPIIPPPIIPAQNDTFKRGKGRFRPDYTSSNAMMINTFSNDVSVTAQTNTANNDNTDNNKKIPTTNQPTHTTHNSLSIPMNCTIVATEETNDFAPNTTIETNNVTPPNGLNNISMNQMNNTNSIPFQRGKGRFQSDMTMSQMPMLNTFNPEPMSRSLPMNNNMNNNNYQRGAVRFSNDYTMQQSATLNAFNSQPPIQQQLPSNNNMNQQQSFQRGFGRFNNDYTMQQGHTLNAFNTEPPPQQQLARKQVKKHKSKKNNNKKFERGKGRFTNDYTMKQSRMIHSYNTSDDKNNNNNDHSLSYKRGRGRFGRDYTMSNCAMIHTYSDQNSNKF